MTLEKWLSRFRPGRGALSWLVREAETSQQSVRKALRGELTNRKVAERISALTDGAVSVATIMGIPASRPQERRKAS